MPYRRSVTLIGMAASGKSTIGRMLAERLGWSFIDVDDLIAEHEGMPIAHVLERVGDDAYVRLEGHLTAVAIAHSETPFIIAPGGSIVYHRYAIERLKQLTHVIYLRASFDVINARIDDERRRTVVFAGAETLKDVYKVRRVLYRRAAHHVVDVQGLEPLHVTARIVGMLNLGGKRAASPSKHLHGRIAR